jgi:hypothetical protein
MASLKILLNDVSGDSIFTGINPCKGNPSSRTLALTW